ncbi:ankyrin repeat-containing protein NPR4-like [Pistacia vera]|uniref:ankyrin repeat-containing protein NPR4-like n=1 Tax=Pistacia vera TaxID=55513 RepID=UPI0012639BF6|nr:ankyrin repeat-containing protein NPR4-like [Pistacia vera]
MSGRKELLLMSQDIDKNNILHLAGNLAPKSQLNRIPSAAIQMQHELQWYKEVEKLVPPDYKEEKNSKGETPRMVFMEEHKGLVKEGQKWMKDSATSFSLAAALIATIVFAAAITVPGDYSDDGRPTFHKRASFKIFAVSDSISLFSSVAAIIIFFSVLTARYSEHDFLYSVPTKFMWGLVMLFLSLTALMVAFCSTVYLVFGDRKGYWILYLVYASASVPLFLFFSWQYPLLRDFLFSTYGPEISRMIRRCLLGISERLRAWYKKSKKIILKLVSCFAARCYCCWCCRYRTDTPPQSSKQNIV